MEPTYSAPPAQNAPTKDERTMAMLAHVLQMFGGFIAPLIIFLVRRDSPFVKFHSLQALTWKLVEMVIIFGGFIVFASAMILSIGLHPKGSPPPGVFFLFPFIWLFVMTSWVINLVIAIYFGIKSYEGEWARYPIIGNLARKWTGMQ
jgi:uncharacterized protein